MVFSSPFFIFVFLPVVLFFIGIAKKKLHNIILLIASLFFYSWGSISHLFILVESVVLNYFLGLLLFNVKKHKKIVLGVSITINLLLLGYFKYFDFFIDNLNSIFSLIGTKPLPLKHIALPIGISFFTFQAISYLIDVYRKETEVQRSFVKLAMYISLFPQLIAGPIVRYNSIAKQLSDRKITLEKASSGIQRFIFGLSKKVIIANSMALIADSVFQLPSSTYGASVAWLGIIAYTFQIYFDFSGYSDMAIGLGRVLGFDFPENFNYPYVSKSIKEFWRRWHISLSSWFKDYLYIPLGGNRRGKFRTLLNLLIVFFVQVFGMEQVGILFFGEFFMEHFYLSKKLALKRY